MYGVNKKKLASMELHKLKTTTQRATGVKCGTTSVAKKKLISTWIQKWQISSSKD